MLRVEDFVPCDDVEEEKYLLLAADRLFGQTCSFCSLIVVVVVVVVVVTIDRGF